MSESLSYYLTQYWKDESDHRTQHLLLVGDFSPFLGIWCISSYILFAKFIGPQLMKNKEPFELRYTMLFYNIIMASFNLIAFVTSVKYSNYGLQLINFVYPDRNDLSEQTLLEIHLGYCYWLTKFLDLIDTLFFVLRKKSSHITLLHLYHHSIVPLFGFGFLRINPIIPACRMFAIVNSFIHVVMYSYYALSALGPNVQKYLWWKKYITIMQLWQFVIYAMYGALVFMFQTNYPIVWLYIGIAFTAFVLKLICFFLCRSNTTATIFLALL
jgi:hypothetical protein